MTLVAPRAGRPAATTYDRVASASAAAVIRGYSTSFGWACRLLAEPVRTHVRNVYALVRVADEIVDEPDGGWADGDRGAALDALEAETYAALRTGRSANLVVHAFAVTARRSGIDRSLVEPFFRSMRADLSVTTHDAESYRDYVHGSAEVVGLMCLRVFVDGDDAAYERLAPAAARLGAAFQKLNFLRDVAEDHGMRGRSYLPGVDCSALTDADRDDVLDDIDDDLAVARRGEAAGLVDRDLRDLLRLGPRHEDPRPDGELEVAERRRAHEVLQRLAPRPPVDDDPRPRD